VALAAVVLRERVRAARWTAVAAGFVGILVILWPRLTGFGGASSGVMGAAALALASTFGMAVSAMFVRRMTATETTGSIVFYFSLLASLVGLSSAPFGWAMPSFEEAVLLVGAGLLGGVGQILLTHAYRHAETSVVAPFDYASMLWGIIIGLVLFQEAPQPNVLLGGAVVIAAGLCIIFRENRLGLRRARQRKVATPQG
jgi:drug/metabolite transporter (DMT)-like permease